MVCAVVAAVADNLESAQDLADLEETNDLRRDDPDRRHLLGAHVAHVVKVLLRVQEARVRRDELAGTAQCVDDRLEV